MQRDLTVLINGSDDMRDLEKYNPIAVITKIQKTKYKFVMIPIILVIFSFVSEKYIGEEISKNLALIGLTHKNLFMKRYFKRKKRRFLPLFYA
jgi:hypothetical protein